MTVIAWDCADDEYRERAYNGMAEENERLRAALKRAYEWLSTEGMEATPDQIERECAEALGIQWRGSDGLPPLGPDWTTEQITAAQERAMAPQSKGGLDR